MASVRKPVVEVRRSQRRRRTVSAYRDGERAGLVIPEPVTRARRLISGYLSDYDASAIPVSVRWVDNQNGRWGSCTPADRTIRISDRIQSFPEWVVDYVLLHELSHLVVANHNAQ